MSVQKSSSFSVFAGAVVAALAVAAGCSGQPHSGGAIPAEPHVLRPAAAVSGTLLLTIQTLLPPAHAPHVVALGFELDGKTASFVPLNIGSNACVQKHGGTLSCSVKFKTATGPHWLTVDGYKNRLTSGKPPSQKPISSNGIPVNVAGAAASVRLDMYEQIAGIVVGGVSAGITGNAKRGFDVDRSVGPDPATFAVVARDAAGNVLIGPSTAAFAIARSNALFTLTTPEPNQFVLDATSTPTAASTKIDVNGKLSFSVSVSAAGSATPTPSPSPATTPTPTSSPGTTPTPVATSTPTPAPTPTPGPVVFITYSTPATPGAVRAFDEQGHTRTLSGSWANLGQPSAIAYDSANAWFYVLTAGASAPIASYDVSGNQIPLSGTFAMTAMGLTVDGNHNHLFVPTHVGTSNDTILGYDEEGGALSLSPGFSTSLVAGGPNALAFDPDNNHLYFADSSTGKIDVYDTSGNSIDVSTKFAQPASCTGGCVPTAVMYAHYNVWPYVIWKNGSQYFIGVYTASGSFISSFTPSVAAPSAMAADDNTQSLYIVGASTVEVTDEFGVVKSTSGAFTPPAGAITATGIAIVPPSGGATRRAGRAIRPHR